MSFRIPPQAPPLFTYSADSLVSRTEQLISCNKKVNDSVVHNVSLDDAEFSNVLLPLQQAKDVMTLEMYPIGFLRSVSTDSAVRDAAASAEKLFSDYKIECSMREDVFKLVESVYKKQRDDLGLDAESRYLLEKEYKAYLRTGLALPPMKRDRLKQINKRLPELYMAFSKNLREEKGGLWFTPKELDGVPADIIETLQAGEDGSENEGRLKLPFQNPKTMAVRKFCTVAETRKKVYVGNENKCTQNIDLLKEAIAIRDEAARMLGYPDHATFVLEDKMAKTPQTVVDFLNDLQLRLTSSAQKELRKLKQLKYADVGTSEHYFLWDHQYYNSQMLSHDFQLNQNKVSEYFPLHFCMIGMLGIFENLFGLLFVKVKGNDRDVISETGRGDDIVWHQDVEIFAVWDNTEGDNVSNFLGYIYFDLLQRDGKFRGAANFTLQPGFSTQEGQRHYPVTALVCSFSSPTASKPSLLKHSEVTTMFHELGHGIHNLVSQTIYGSFHGTYTTRDFVEAPSQMLENWCWTSSEIKALSKHWSYLSPEYEKAYMDMNGDSATARPGKEMPEAMIQSIIGTRHVNEALSCLSLLQFALFDIRVHSPKSHEEALNVDVSGLYNKIRCDVSLLEDTGETEQCHGVALMSHVMAGYDALVYGYLWSEVYAADIFHTAFNKDPSDKKAGEKYRKTVLQPGGSRDPMELLREFLGREPSVEPFYQGLSIV